jgi:hypothetical protein
MWEHFHGDWSQIPAERTNTIRTAWLHTPNFRQNQTPPDPTMLSFACLVPELSPSGFYFNVFLIARAVHASSQVWRALALNTVLKVPKLQQHHRRHGRSVL